MAQIPPKPSKPFNFQTPDDWSHDGSAGSPNSGKRWDLSERASSSKWKYCFTALGKAQRRFTTEENRKEYNKPAQFNQRNQLSGETAEQYIITQDNLAEFCDYGDLKNKMIRDRLIVGIRDTALSKKLQLIYPKVCQERYKTKRSSTGITANS